MNKKELMNRGISEEHADIVIEMLKDSYVPLYRFNEINDKMKSYKSQVEEKTEEIKTLSSKVKDTEKLESENQKLRDDMEKAATDHATALTTIKKSNALTDYLRDKKAKNVKAVMALLDMEKITFENDTLAGHEDQVTSLMESENSKFMFDSGTGYTPKGTQPGQATGGTATGNALSFRDAIANAINIKK